MPASQPSQPGSCPLQRDRGAIGPTVPLSQTSQISQIGRSAYLARPQAWDEGEGAQGGPGGIELEPRGSRGKLFAQEPAGETGHSARTHGPGWPGVLDRDASCRMQFFLSHANAILNDTPFFASLPGCPGCQPSPPRVARLQLSPCLAHLVLYSNLLAGQVTSEMAALLASALRCIIRACMVV